MAQQSSERERLPFEPRQKKKKTLKKPAQTAPAAAKSSVRGDRTSGNGIPQAVSQRMVRRMALFSGIPTALGMTSFIAAYWVVSHDLFDLPTSAVLAVSLGFFGLGVLGLSYGIFSTSWDENYVGSRWGWQEFRENFRKTVSAWRSAKKEAGEN